MKSQNNLFNEFTQGIQRFIDLYVEEYGFLFDSEKEDEETVTLVDGFNTEIKIKTKLQNRKIEGDNCSKNLTLTLHEHTIDFSMNTQITIISNDTEEIDCITNEWKSCLGMEI